MEYISSFVWEKGSRMENEDAFCIREMERDGKSYLFAAVCDGIGGLEEGKNAATFTISFLRDALPEFLEQYPEPVSGRQMKRFFLRKIFACHERVRRYGTNRKMKLGTTISMLVLRGDKGFLFHMGDRSIYVGKQKLKKKTKDQRNKKGALVRAIGAGNFYRPYAKKLCICKGTSILLCSDGFSGKNESFLCKKEFLKNMGSSKERMQNKLEQITKETLLRKEADNITAVFIKRIK